VIKVKLLLVEDDRDLSRALNKILTYNKYDVEAVYDGLSAIEAIKSNDYSVVVLDIMLPQLNGIEVLQQIREAGFFTPVILLTAKSQLEDKIVGLDAGADDYITKPFDSKELLARIRAVTRRVTTEVKFLSFGNCSLDFNTFELIAESNIGLTSKEYKLMELLMLNTNLVLSSERILNSIWTIDDDVEINVVWVFISMLRKKLEQIGANCYIKAIRGIGYQLDLLKHD